MLYEVSTTIPGDTVAGNMLFSGRGFFSRSAARNRWSPYPSVKLFESILLISHLA